jgi:hypothetical protein
MKNTKITITIPIWLDKILIQPVLIYRRLKYGFAYRRIPVGEGYFAIVDQCKYYFLNQFHWILRKTDVPVSVYRVVGGKKTKLISMQGDILKPRKNRVIDHHNRNPLDNRITNLRYATRSQNCQNRSKARKQTSSRFRGVYREKGHNCWIATIQYNGKRIRLGRFANESDAARAYDEAAIKYFREFANLNFPERGAKPCGVPHA